jgi:hypothetical protein
MQTAFYGSYSNGTVTLDEVPEHYSKARVVVLFVEDDPLILSRKKKTGVLTKSDFSPAFFDTKNWCFNREEANER